MSLRQQYLAKLGSNFLGILAGLLTLLVVPRELGPAGYGRYEFLSNLFLQIKNLFETGSSAYFFTRLSQQPEDSGLVRFYRRLLGLTSLLIIGGVLLISFTPAGPRLWAGEPTVLVLLAAVLACLQWWLDIVRKMNDAYHLTVRAETAYAISRLSAAVLLVVLTWTVGLTLGGYFTFMVVSTLLMAILLENTCRKHATAGKTHEESQSYLTSFWNYSHPLLTYSLAGVIAGVANRWILQVYGGSLEQGYFGLASQVSAVCFFFTSAISQLFTREFAVAWDREDHVRMHNLFMHVIPLLYVVAAYFCCFVVVNASTLASLIGGKAYSGGTPALAIMAIYPMYQTYGQLSGSIYYATGHTRLYRNIGLIGFLSGPPLVFWLVAPAAYGGLDSGALGLAIVTVVQAFISVNVGLWFNAKILGLDFKKLIVHQILVFVIFGACAASVDWICRASGLAGPWSLLFNGSFYTVLVLALLGLFPKIAGLERVHLARIFSRKVV